MNPRKGVELDFWRHFAEQGITDAQARESAHKFKAVYDELEAWLNQAVYLAGTDLTLLDIAWFIHTNRLMAAGYLFARLHPSIYTWYVNLLNRKAFARGVKTPAPLQVITAALHALRFLKRTGIRKVAGL